MFSDWNFVSISHSSYVLHEPLISCICWISAFITNVIKYVEEEDLIRRSQLHHVQRYPRNKGPSSVHHRVSRYVETTRWGGANSVLGWQSRRVLSSLSATSDVCCCEFGGLQHYPLTDWNLTRGRALGTFLPVTKAHHKVMTSYNMDWYANKYFAARG
jgi:hypothetical protein